MNLKHQSLFCIVISYKRLLEVLVLFLLFTKSHNKILKPNQFSAYTIYQITSTVVISSNFILMTPYLSYSEYHKTKTYDLNSTSRRVVTNYQNNILQFLFDTCRHIMSISCIKLWARCLIA